MDSVIVRRAILDTVGLFDENLDGAEDKDFALRIARRAPCIGLPRVAALARLHARTLTAESVARWKKRYEDEMLVL
ncbi:hypothetical protein ACKI1O_53455, partial [Streptomyces scabiei]